MVARHEPQEGIRSLRRESSTLCKDVKLLSSCLVLSARSGMWIHLIITRLPRMWTLTMAAIVHCLYQDATSWLLDLDNTDLHNEHVSGTSVRY